MLNLFKTLQKSFLLALFSAGLIFGVSKTTLADDGWGQVRSVSGQCFVERDVSGVGKVMIYNKGTSFGFVFVVDEGLELSANKRIVTFVKEDGFSDYYKLEQQAEQVVTFDVPLLYFEQNSPTSIKEVILYSSGAQTSFSFNMNNALFSNLSQCDLRATVEKETEIEVLELSKVRDDGVFDVFFDEYIVQEQSANEGEIIVERLKQDTLEDGFAKAPTVEESIFLDDQDPPFIETAQETLQENIFIPVDTVIQDVQVNLDEQLEIIDSLTEKIKILELEKQYLREELDSEAKDPIKMVVGATTK